MRRGFPVADEKRESARDFRRRRHHSRPRFWASGTGQRRADDNRRWRKPVQRAHLWLPWDGSRRQPAPYGPDTSGPARGPRRWSAWAAGSEQVIIAWSGATVVVLLIGSVTGSTRRTQGAAV